MDFRLNDKQLPPPINIQVSSIKSPGKLLVIWDKVTNPDQSKIDASIVDPSLIKEIQYNVYRSISLGGIFYKVTAQPVSQPRYEDNNVNRNPNTQHFYKVSTVLVFNDGSISEGELSPPVIYRVTTTNKWFKKINERNMWILKNTGVLMDLYIRKTEGQRCHHCYDALRSQGDPDCLYCFGTTYEGGYEPMTQLYIRQKPAMQQLDLTPHGYVPNNSPGAWTISNIQIHNRDLLINPEGRIFSVLNSNVSHAAGYLFHQELSMKELDPMDKRYKIQRSTLYPEW